MDIPFDQWLACTISDLYCPQTAAVQGGFHNHAASGARRATGMAIGQPYPWTMVCFLSRLCNISAMAVTFYLVCQLGRWTSSSACIYLGTGWQNHPRSHSATIHQGLSQQASGMTACLQRGRSYDEPYAVLHEVQHAACDDGFTEIVMVCGPPPLKPTLPSSPLTIFL